MNSNLRTTAQAAALLAGNPNAEHEVQQEINNSRLVSKLISLRVAKGLTQEKIAEAMDCDPSKISRLESGNDYGLKYVDVARYVQALNVDMLLEFHDPDAAATDQIKTSVFRIHENLEKLCELAKQVGENDQIAEKIHQFYGEVLFNFLVRYQDSYGKLPKPMRVTVPDAQSSMAYPAESAADEAIEKKCAP